MFAKKSSLLFISMCIVVIALLFVTTNAHAAPVDNFPVTVTQPDGTQLNLFASGDEFYNWLQDAQGYTVIQNPVSGYYVYADLVNGKLVPTNFIAGRVDPAAAGLRPYLNISPEQKNQIRQAFLDQTKQKAGEIRNAPTKGAINNLVIFIRFSDESEFTDTTSTYTSMLNSSTAGANSLRNYYKEVSYNTLTINSTLLPTPGTTVVSYQDSNPRGYYQPYNDITNPIGYTGGDNGSVRTFREHTLLKDAINYISSLGQFPSGTSIDSDGDGYVDSITFIVSGGADGWASLLWPHQWSLYSFTVTINGKTVSEYSLQLNSMLYTGVLAHEMFHVLGSPDLYHYTGNGIQPVGGWDVMENDANPPQHMGCYMKFKYGDWIASIPEISSPGTYVLNPLTSSTGNCYKIASPYSTTEYFVVEYRNATGTFEGSLPGTGLLVYRINTLAAGNSNGPPDEVYIYRPGGTTSLNGDVNTANFSSNVGRTAINDGTNPSSFLSSGSVGGLNICNVGASGATLSFDICAMSGFVISGNAGVAGTTLTYTGGSATADGSGLYTFMVSSGWTGTVTPSKTGYTFSPVSKSYTNVLANQTLQNYTATSTGGNNDDFNYPILVSGLPYANTQSIAGYTTAVDDPILTCSSGQKYFTTWYQYTPSQSKMLTVDTIGSDYDTVLAVWTGTRGSLISVGCDDDSGGNLQSLLSVYMTAGTTYYIEATSFSASPSGTSLTLNVSAPVTPPGAFNKISPLNGATGQATSPTLSWDVSSSATSYEYCYDTSNDNACASWVSTGTTASANLSGLSAGSTYYWQVRANNANGTTYADGSDTVYWSFTAAAATPPGAFAKISPSNGASGQPIGPILSWGDSSGAASYEYCYDTTNDNACASWISTGTTASANLSGLSYGATYYWQVRAKNSYGTTYANGSSTAYWSFSVTTDVLWTGTTNRNWPMSFTVNSSGTQWSTFKLKTDVSACSLTMETTVPGPGAITNGQFSRTGTFSFTGTFTSASTASGTYSYTNFVIPGCSPLTQTGTWNASIPLPPPGAFGKTTPANNAIGQSVSSALLWGSSTNAASYEYCYDTINNDSCDTSWINAGANTSVNLSGLIGHTTYYWQVRANGNAQTTYADGGAWWSFTTAVFADVPASYWAYSYIERLYLAGITSGCGTNPLIYCPNATVTRAQMAIFLLRGMHGSTYAPPSVGASTGFNDVAPTDFAAAWIKQLALEGITGGCGPSLYCPNATVTRAQMAIFLLRGEHGSGYTPPAVGGSTGFNDVAPTDFAAAWIKQLAAESITSGCGPSLYCPVGSVTRAEMAIFLVRAFSLP